MFVRQAGTIIWVHLVRTVAQYTQICLRLVVNAIFTLTSTTIMFTLVTIFHEIVTFILIINGYSVLFKTTWDFYKNRYNCYSDVLFSSYISLDNSDIA